MKAAIGDEQVPGVRSNVIYSKYVMTGIIIQIPGHAGGGITDQPTISFTYGFGSATVYSKKGQEC